MKKTPFSVETAPDANVKSVQRDEPTTCIPFKISGLQRVSYGTKSATFIVAFDGVQVDADLFEPAGRDAFVQPASVRDKFSGQWVRRTRFSRPLAQQITAAVLKELAQNGRASADTSRAVSGAPKSSAGSEFFEEQERRFDGAFDALETGSNSP
jgi:hypothetical protein